MDKIDIIQMGAPSDCHGAILTEGIYIHTHHGQPVFLTPLGLCKGRKNRKGIYCTSLVLPLADRADWTVYGVEFCNAYRKGMQSLRVISDRLDSWDKLHHSLLTYPRKPAAIEAVL